MHILITGGTGLIGQALIAMLPCHQLTVLTRNVAGAETLFNGKVKGITQLNEVDFNHVDAVINLAGEPIADRRWSAAQKQRICDSRWSITSQLVAHICAAKTPPQVLISGSAVGYYGDQGDLALDETIRVDSQDFAHLVCAKWEDLALKAQSPVTRVCILRTGIVLSCQGGALAKMLLPYQWGFGGTLGSGGQYMPWIHIQDMVEGILHLLYNAKLHGIFNFTAPNPVTQRMFSQTLAALLHRPNLCYVPEMMLKLMLGEMAQLLLDSQRALPKALEGSGYHFHYPMLQSALTALISPSQATTQ